MRKQSRPAEPAVLTENAARWNAQWADLRSRNPSAGFAWYVHKDRDARDWILEDLRAMTQGHCAFCDSFPLEDRDLEAVEHFRPKTREAFYHLAYDWGNLYYCCGKCQKSKGSAWDDALLHPDAEGYDCTWFFEFDFESGEIRPAGHLLPGHPEDWRRAEITITIYDLNSRARQRCRVDERDKWEGQPEDKRILDKWAYRDFIQPG